MGPSLGAQAVLQLLPLLLPCRRCSEHEWEKGGVARVCLRLGDPLVVSSLGPLADGVIYNHLLAAFIYAGGLAQHIANPCPVHSLTVPEQQGHCADWWAGNR